jgi:hypothetical protein
METNMRGLSLFTATAVVCLISGISPGSANPVDHPFPATAEHKAVVEAYETSCQWVAKAMPDPSWRPFLTRLNDACDVIAEGGYLLNPVKRSPPADAAVHFVEAMKRVTEGLDALYMKAWISHLQDEDGDVETIGLNDAGVFLAFRHEDVFRLADRVLGQHRQVLTVAGRSGVVQDRGLQP